MLNPLGPYPSDIPSWVVVKMIRAIRENYGVNSALQFAARQEQNGEVQLAEAELLIQQKQFSEAIKILTSLKNENNQLSNRSRRLLGKLYTDLKHYDMAKEVILEDTSVAESVSGKETLAKIALQQGRIADAENIYNEIQQNSGEARSYLARKGILEKDWEKAKALTVLLIHEYPNNQVLRDNLEKN